LLRMPETQTMETSLATYEKKLAEDLQIRQRRLQSLYADYQEFAKTTQDEAQLKPRQDEILNLEKEIQTKSVESQQKLMERREKQLSPILEKLQNAITEISDARGYTLILNQMDGSGMSVVLKGPEEDDITIALMEKLGIKTE
ncbi:MAG: OmpH family outer membrane protein, partial [Bacteroidota bacterium]